MVKEVSIERGYRSAAAMRKVNALHGFDAAEYAQLLKLGIDIPPNVLRQMMLAASAMTGMDALDFPLTTPSVTTPVQFLQNWLPGFVQIITGARRIDELVGMSTTGAWEDEEVVQGIMELLGGSVPYGDYTNIPLSSWNVNFDERTVVRFEEGMQVGLLEEARASRMRANSAASKREAASLALEIQRNSIGFYGYNGGANLTYGFLNDPALPAYVEVPAGASGGHIWASKTFLEICADLRTAFSALRAASQDTIDPMKTRTILALPTSVIDYLSVTAVYGTESVREWLAKTYPNCEPVSAPELELAYAGDNVFYLYAEMVSDGSSDDGRVFIQPVPTKFRVNGVQQMAKGYTESYSNATAGVWCKRPYAVVRYYHI